MNSALTILGGLGVFLFGLKVMSNGLQKLAGARLRAFLAGMTRNRFTGIFSGFLMTCAVQSSSATTVLVVSFANAGLLTLAQAMGLVMGANIGTTLTAWLVSLLGFKVKIASFALPIIGIGFPMSLLKNRRVKHLSEVLVGFGLLFLGLAFLKSGVPDLKANPEFLEFAKDLASYGWGSRVLFVAIGAVLTVVVQSSSAASAITLTMVANGWIQLDLAAAMILGENIGTTITAQLASIGANRNARRVANFHTLFNVIGVLWMLPLMGVFMGLIQEIIPGDPLESKLVATTQVALFHTMFNVTNTFVLVWFVSKLEKVVLRMVPLRDGELEASRLSYLATNLVDTTEFAIVEVRRGISDMLKLCQTMFKDARVGVTDKKKLTEVAERVRADETITDEMEEELVLFCSQLASATTSNLVASDIAVHLEMANDVERIGDHCKQLILLAERSADKGYSISDVGMAELAEMFDLVDEFFAVTADTLSDGESSLVDAKRLEDNVNNARRKSRKRHANLMQTGTESVRQGIIFLDLLTNMEKIGDYCWNVCALAHPEQRETVKKESQSRSSKEKGRFGGASATASRKSVDDLDSKSTEKTTEEDDN